VDPRAKHATWRLRPTDEAAVARLQRGLDLHPVLGQVLVSRGIIDESEVQRFLDPQLKHLTPPGQMAGLDKAIERLTRAVVERESIGIFGDYDVDGVSSTALLGDYLRQCEADVSLRVARRDEGYGFGPPQATEMAQRGCKVLVLLDCGTSDHEAVQVATDAGVDVIAVDHHRLTRDRWPGFVLVNPHRPDCGFPFKGLATVGLAFYVVASLRRSLEARGLHPPDPRESLDLVALGTVADVAPLKEENRILVARGLERLAGTRRPGLTELLRLCNMTTSRPTSAGVGWRLGPRLNAPGRLGDASVSLDCLWQLDPSAGIKSARACDALNEERKQIQGQVQEQAFELAQGQVDGGRSFLVIAGDDWHPGVIGIVAGRLASAFQRPTAVVSLQGEVGKASARSVPGVDLVGALGQCSEHLLRYGGHAAAAGFALEREALEAFHDGVDAVVAPQLGALEERPLELDCELPLGQVTWQLCQQLARLGPHGDTNPEPVFVAKGVLTERSRAIGADHLGLELRQGSVVKSAIGFGMLGQRPERGEQLDVAFVPEIDDYRGTERLRMRLVDLRRTGDGPPLSKE
jgi:single-stranded-DNA-specific exonuclease